MESEIVSIDVLLPKLGFAMAEGLVAGWLAADGAAVLAGKPLYVLESDKSAEEIESPASGRLRIIAKAGETYPVGTVLAKIE
jgi:pyruvate/2-oxoglutarate dehydrogenase complex dihydrolipoamide acyltransferase (E2) component